MRREEILLDGSLNELLDVFPYSFAKEKGARFGWMKQNSQDEGTMITTPPDVSLGGLFLMPFNPVAR
jgi:hypothetical protein